MEPKLRLINWKCSRPFVAESWALEMFKNGKWVCVVPRGSDTGTIKYFLKNYGRTFESLPVVVKIKK